MTKAALAALPFLVAAIPFSFQSKGEAACRSTAKALGFAVAGSGKATKSGDITTLKWGDVTCQHDGAGRVRSIIDFSAYKVKMTAAKVTNAKTAVEIARTRLAATGFKLIEPAFTSTPEPWSKEVVHVQVSSARTAFGKPTHGFAGGVGVLLHRGTGKIVALSWSEEFKPEKPVVKIKQEDAVRIATPLFAKLREPGKATSMSALLQYFRPSKGKATAAGKQMLDAKRLRFCWIVALANGPKMTEMSAVIASVAVDAETGQVLANP